MSKTTIEVADFYPCPVVEGGLAGVLFEDAAEMSHVAVAYQRGDVVDAAGGVGLQFLGALHPQGVDDVQKALLEMPVDELGKVPLTDVDVVGNIA